MEEGTYRIVHREKINHCFEMYDTASIGNTVSFFNDTLGMGSDLNPFSHIWFGKEISNGFALAAAFTFIISMCAVLMRVPFFATIRKDNAKNIGEVSEEKAEPVCETAVCAEAVADTEVKTKAPPAGTRVTARQKPKSVAHKIIFWSTMILTAIIACLDYIPLANWSIEIFPVGNSSSVYTFVFPARMINAILLWAAINGAIGLVLFFGTTLLENLYEYIVAKKKGIDAKYDWSKFTPIKMSGKGAVGVLCNVLKMLLLGVILIGAFYLMVHVSYWIFHQDFRFMLISAAPLNARMIVTSLEYIPIIFIFYISNSIRVNCSIGREGWKEWKVL